MGTGEFNAGVKPCEALACQPRGAGVEMFPVALCYENRDRLRTDGPLTLYADFFVKAQLS